MPQSNRLCCFCTNPEYEGSLNDGYHFVREYISHTGDFRTAPLRAQRSSRHLAGQFCYRAADRAAEPSNGTTFYLPETQDDNSWM